MPTNSAVAKNDAAEANKAIVSDEAWGNLSSIGDAMKYLSELGAVPESIADYGSGLTVVEDKDTLVKRAFFIVEWSFREGDHGDYVSALIITGAGEKLVLNDGSTGIRDQLRAVTNKRVADGKPFPQQGIAVPNGLRASHYTYTDEKGEQKPATTYYLS